MQLSFHCPGCGGPFRAEISDPPGRMQCPYCDWSRDVRSADVAKGKPQRCLACGNEDLWRQKDFPQRLGLLIVVLGALLSTVAWANYWPRTALGILMLFALADLLLYTLMKDVLVCYRCWAKHRRTAFDADHPRFDLEVAERYRQEAIRLKSSTKSNG